jgi:hypothetical protein
MDDDLKLLEPESEKAEGEEEGYLEGPVSQWLHRLAEEDQGWQRIAGAGIILLGGALVFAAAFTIKNPNDSYPDLHLQVFNTGFLIFGALIMTAAVLALIWRASYVGSIFALSVCGYLLYETGGAILSFNVNFSYGIYLIFAGALLGLLGGLICLSMRGTGYQAEIDWRDQQISALEGVVEALTTVWEEADKLEEERIEGSTTSMADYDNASFEAERRLQEYHLNYEL